MRQKRWCLLAFLAISACAGDEIINATLKGAWDGGGRYADVWAEGDFVFLAQFGNSFIDIIDIADPSTPQHVLRYDLAPPNHASSAQDVKYGDGLLFIGLEGLGNGCQIVDLRDPYNPVALTDTVIPDFNRIHNVFYHEGFLYMVDSGSPRIGIIDLRGFDPDNPPTEINTPLWMMNDVGFSIVHDITVTNGRLYACAWDSGLWVYDISDIANQPPRFLGSAPGNSTHSAWPTDDGQYVITGEERTGGGIKVFRMDDDGADGLDLVLTDEETLPPLRASSVHNQVTVGYRVFNSWYGAGLRVYDVNPASGLLELYASYDTQQTDGTWGVYPFLGEDRVLISDMNTGLFVIDVANEPVPVVYDLNDDGLVNLLDMVTVCTATTLPCLGCAEDVNRDGKVDNADLLLLASQWLNSGDSAKFAIR